MSSHPDPATSLLIDIDIELARTMRVITVHADASGLLRFVYHVPWTVSNGHQILVLSQVDSDLVSAVGQSSGTGAHLQASIPTVRPFPFEVRH